MRELIIGMDGFIGRNLCRHIPDALKTTRCNASLDAPGVSYFDMLNPGPLPDADVVYICTGVNGALTVSQDTQRAYRVNVDGTIYVADYYPQSTFIVWLGSTTCEWSTEHYGRQKQAAESYLRRLPNVGIIRAGRVLQSNVDDLCELMMDVGRNRKRGVRLWGEDEKPYQK